MNYEWQRWPEAEALLQRYVDDLLAHHEPARRLSDDLGREASTRLLDWLDHLVVAGDAAVAGAVQSAGFVPEAVAAPTGTTVYRHPGAQLPRVALRHAEAAAYTEVLALKADAVEDFLLVRGMQAPVEGSRYSPYRTATVWSEGGRRVIVAERRGERGLIPVTLPDSDALLYLALHQRWATRPRRTDDDLAGMAATLDLARDLAAAIGRDRAAWLVFEIERDYWQRRNWAGQVQKARQDRLGLGWANHDHHTFRSSRAAFATLISTLEALGFETRERFYAGAEAGWGAQVLEQPACGLVVFADVDLSPHETELDFAHQRLSDAPHLGTVGLWCALHGESLLGAGMHHLEAQFEFDRLRDDLTAAGISMMKPFSDMPHLRQAFTKGERWPVAPQRLTRLLASGGISQEQHDRFLREGAVGSHLENLQRRDGYKGFNQHNVSTIIKETDPRYLTLV